MSARELGNALGNPLALPRSQSGGTSNIVSEEVKKVISNVVTTITFLGSTQSLLYTPILFGTNKVLIPARYFTDRYYYGYIIYDINDDLSLSNEYRSTFTTDSSSGLWYDAQWHYTVSDIYVIRQSGGTLRGLTLINNVLTVSLMYLNTSGTYTNSGTYTSQSFIQHMIIDGVILTFCYDNNNYISVQTHDLNFNLISVTKTGSTITAAAPTCIYKTDFGFLVLYAANDGSTSVNINFKTLSNTFTHINTKSINISSSGSYSFAASTSYFDGNIASVILYTGNSSKWGYKQACLKIRTSGVMTTTYTEGTGDSQYTSFLVGNSGSSCFYQNDSYMNILGVRALFSGYVSIMHDGKNKLPLLKAFTPLTGVGVGGYSCFIQQVQLQGEELDSTRLDLTLPKATKKIFGLFGSSYYTYSQDVNIAGNFVLGQSASYSGQSTYLFIGKIA